MIRIPNVRVVGIDDLRVDDKNPNKMRSDLFEALKKNLSKFGFIVPIITNEDLLIADGEHRWRAAKELGMSEVPVISLPVSEVDRRMLRQVLNKLRGEHDIKLDDEEYRFFLEQNEFEEFKSLVGFSNLNEVRFLADISEPEDDAFDVDCALSEAGDVGVRVGDVFLLGEHKLVCGDCADNKFFDLLLGDERVDMVFTSPPYNLNYKTRNKRIGGGVSTIVGDNLSRDEYVRFLNLVFGIVKGYCADSCSLYVWLDWRSFCVLFSVIGSLFFIETVIIWDKVSAKLGFKYRNQMEMLLFSLNSEFKDNERPYIDVIDCCIYGLNNKKVGKWFGGRSETNVWYKTTDYSNHYMNPTQKPIELPFRAIRNSSERDDIILDVFGGSGSTLIACEQLGRKCRMMEIDPLYCDVIIKRWEAYTNKKAKKL